MIVKSLTLDDDIANFYADEAAARKVTLEVVLADRLARAGILDPRDRPLLLEPRSRERLEEILGGGSIASAEDLLGKVRRLAAVKFGEHSLELTTGQLEELKWRAKKQGKTVEELLQATWDAFKINFFDLIPAKK